MRAFLTIVFFVAVSALTTTATAQEQADTTAAAREPTSTAEPDTISAPPTRPAPTGSVVGVDTTNSVPLTPEQARRAALEADRSFQPPPQPNITCDQMTESREALVSGNRLTGETIGGERIRRLEGNVQLCQDETQLWANRAVEYVDRQEVNFAGNVLVVERGDSLRADAVLYNKRMKTGRARGNVRLSDGEVQVYAPSGFYYTRQKRADFTEGVTLIDSTAVLVSDGGTYWSDEKRAEFYGGVRLDEDRTHLEADSVTYFRDSEESIARGNVFIERLGDESEDPDLTIRTLLFGEYAYNDNETSFSRISGHPLLIQLRTDTVKARVDTLLMRATVLEASRRDSLQRLVAVNSVRIWQRDLAAVADSAVYDRIKIEDEVSKESVRLFREPLTWFQNNQVTGDTIRVKARDGGVDTLWVDSGAFVARLDTTIDRVHQLKGRSLVGYFREDTLRTLAIGPNAEAINFRTEEGKPNGAVSMSADRVVFYFEGDDVQRITAVRGIEGTYYSEDQMPQDLKLGGFTWTPDRRPRRSDLLGEVMIPPPRLDTIARDEAPADFVPIPSLSAEY